MNAYTVLLLVTVQAVCQAQTTNPNTTTTKPKTFLEELQSDFLNLGKTLAVKAIGGAVEIGCRRGCPRLCEDKVGQYFCAFVCAPCTRLRRSVRQSSVKGHLTPMPNKFSAYDINDDGVVSVKELAFVTGPGTTEADVRGVLNMADSNGDGVLTPRELYEGPFVFEMDVSDSDYMYSQYIASRMARNRQQVTDPMAP